MKYVNSGAHFESKNIQCMQTVTVSMKCTPEMTKLYKSLLKENGEIDFYKPFF